MSNQATVQVREQTAVAIVTARGNSKGLPRKNLRLLDGKPLLVHTIEAALISAYVSRCVVSTEDAEIATVAARCGAEVVIRPAKLSRDESSSQEVVRHALAALEYPPAFVLLQPTSPLRTAAHIDACLSLFFTSGAASVVSVCPVAVHPFKMLRLEEGNLVPFSAREYLSMPRQTLPLVYRQNGSIYVASTESFLRHDAFILPPSVPYVMTEEESVDIDTGFDLEVAELLVAQRRKK